MAMTGWEPLGDLHTVQNEMERLFDAESGRPAHANDANSTLRRWIPPMDLVETAESYIVRADLPGLSDADVNVEFEDDVLTISGARKAEREDRAQGYYRVERDVGEFSRSLTLPEGINPDSLRAHFDRGVLEIRIPKPEQRKPQKIAISLGPSIERR